MHPRAILPLLAVLLAAVTFVPAADAQSLPAGTNPCGALTVTPGQPEATFTAGEAIDVSVTVKIQGGNGVDADVVLNLTAPAGWTVPADGLQFTNVGTAGKTASFRVTAPQTLTAGAAAQNLAITSTYRCYANLNDQHPALTGSTPGPKTTVLLKARAPTSAVPFLDQTMLLALGAVGAVIVVVLLAILLTRRPKTAAGAAVVPAATREGLLLACDEPEKRVRLGRGTSFPIRLENRGDQPDQVRLEVTDVPEGWTAFMSNQEVQVGPKDQRLVWLLVRAPPEGAIGERVPIGVTGYPREAQRERPEVRVAAVTDAAKGDPRVDERTGVSV